MANPATDTGVVPDTAVTNVVSAFVDGDVNATLYGEISDETNGSKKKYRPFTPPTPFNPCIPCGPVTPVAP